MTEEYWAKHMEGKAKSQSNAIWNNVRIYITDYGSLQLK